MEHSDLFLDNKYTKWYYSIVERAANRVCETNQYYEQHHIIPRSIGGAFKGIVRLTAKEHYLCHILLFKMVIDSKHRRSMAYALWCMKGKNRWHKERFTGIMYQLLKVKLSEYYRGENNPFFGKGYLVTGENNHFFGKRHDEETKRRMGENHSSTAGAHNGFYGKKHTDETKRMLSEQRLGRPLASGPYRLVSPDGIEFIVTEGINKFCKEHKLVGPNVIQAAQKAHKSRGWFVELYEKNSN